MAPPFCFLVHSYARWASNGKSLSRQWWNCRLCYHHKWKRKGETESIHRDDVLTRLIWCWNGAFWCFLLKRCLKVLDSLSTAPPLSTVSTTWNKKNAQTVLSTRLGPAQVLHKGFDTDSFQMVQCIGDLPERQYLSHRFVLTSDPKIRLWTESEMIWIKL